MNFQRHEDLVLVSFAEVSSKTEFEPTYGSILLDRVNGLSEIESALVPAHEQPRTALVFHIVCACALLVAIGVEVVVFVELLYSSLAVQFCVFVFYP